MKIIIIISLLSILTGCKSTTVEGAFKSKHSNNEVLYIHSDQEDKGAVVFYQAQFTEGIGIGAAVIEGNDQQGWNHVTSSAMFSKDDDFIFNSERVNYLEDTSIRLYYGVINDLKAKRIVIDDKNGNEIDANIIETEWKRIWYGFVPVEGELKLRVYDKEEKILFEIPGNT